MSYLRRFAFIGFDSTIFMPLYIALSIYIYSICPVTPTMIGYISPLSYKYYLIF
jgi:hypothetical protein